MGQQRGTPKRSGRQAIGGSAGLLNSHPPEITSSFALRKRFRFIADADCTDVSITRDNVVALFGMGYHSVAANGIYRMIDSYRVLNVTIRHVPAFGSSSTVALEWAGLSARSVRYQDTSMGISPAMISSSPPEGTLCSFWSSVAADESLFTLTCPDESVVDLTLDLVLVDGLGVFYTAVSNLTDAAFSIKPLDSLISGTAGHLQPQGYKYTFQN
jgi:hypothetical protein